MTPEELEQIAEDERAEQGRFTQRVNVCVAAGCLSCQSQSVKDALDQEVNQRGAQDRCQVKGVGCMGLCSEGPLVSTSAGVLYKKVEAADGPAILDSLESSPVERLVCPTDVPFFQRQQEDRAGKFRRHRSRSGRGLHCRQRLHRADQGADRDVAARGD